LAQLREIQFLVSTVYNDCGKEVWRYECCELAFRETLPERLREGGNLRGWPKSKEAKARVKKN
jgi:hypothetical protein